MKKLLLTLLFVPFIGALNSNAQGSSCQAAFQFSNGACPEIMFFDGSYTDSTDQIISWNWNFGDQNSSNSASPTNVYQANDQYEVCLTIVTANQCTSTFCQTVVVDCIGGGGAGPCEAMFQYTMASCPEVMFYDGSSADSTDQVISWEWDFGDQNTASTSDASNVYQANGQYLVCLTIVTANQCTSTYCDSVWIDCIIGLNEIQNSNFVLSPNPAVNDISLNFDNANSLEYKIIGMNGSIYDSGNNDSAIKHTFNVSHLESGIYLLEINIEGMKTVTRFIKK